jgi:sugar phosphate permease
MEFLLLGGAIASIGVLWVILRLENDPLEQGIRQANEWSSDQRKLREVMPK